MTIRPAANADLVLVAAVADLRAPWEQPERPVELIEEPIADLPGWSLYRLEGGKAAALSETPRAEWTQEFLFGALVRAVANLAQTCPACGGRARIAGGGEDGLSRGVMEHEAVCPVADDGMRDAAGRGERVGPLPDGPRTWEVWAPRLRRGYRPRRAFS